jgi:hypothetical protein
VVIWSCHPSPEYLVETRDQVRYQRRGARHREADDPAVDLDALDLARLFFREAGLTENLLEGGGDAIGIWVPGENRVLPVEVVDIIDIGPLIGGGIRRSVLEIVQDQLVLCPHTVIYRHVALPRFR